MTRAMKNSGINWIGEIPEKWEVLPIYTTFDEVTEKNYSGKVKNALRFSFGTIVPKENFNSDNDDYVANTILNYTIVEPGTIVLNGLNLNYDFVTKRVALVNDFGVITSAYLTFKPKLTKATSKFMMYLLKSYDHCRAFHGMGEGVRKILNYSELKKHKILLPPLSEQQAIADFLDDKCAEIDNLSAAITEQIEVLKQYKKSVITEAVTKGLNPNAPMKDSGVEWIGTIPENWEVEKLKYNLYRINILNTGNNIVLSLYRDYGIIPKDSRDDNHNVTSQDTSKYRQVAIGNFVVNKMKAWQGSVAVSNYKGIVSPAYYVYGFRNKNINKIYFHYLMRSCYKDEFRRLSGGIREGQWDLPAEALENSLIIIPPLSEQQAIADYLDDKCAQIDSVIKDKETQLETLAAYKKSLIYEYVTGKKEVPQLKEV